MPFRWLYVSSDLHSLKMQWDLSSLSAVTECHRKINSYTTEFQVPQFRSLPSSKLRHEQVQCMLRYCSVPKMMPCEYHILIKWSSRKVKEANSFQSLIYNPFLTVQYSWLNHFLKGLLKLASSWGRISTHFFTWGSSDYSKATTYSLLFQIYLICIYLFCFC